ncbi:protoporphyrinogen oxidase-like protein [candidate division KSB3 bacterium]|uniref:Protoporphyrinogen oxidase-like protein n=1 Tax=candidate division KSB3 bacterium TaxID=2044937 RepID=A0A2G6K8B2_9BACT|nr:MAG: protoporphyrinogen oxidase-like protein [candidate division KSB3 bacterium]
MNLQSIILGAGMTGLAAGVTSGMPIFEAASVPGGICASYYIRPGAEMVTHEAPADGEAYRFEIGGGHWIFGADSCIRRFLEQHAGVKQHERVSSVYFRKKRLSIPYPLQNHLRYLDDRCLAQALKEIVQPQKAFSTMRDWLETNFGTTLCKLFFFPFHEYYTAGLYPRIAPQDAYKSPVNLTDVIHGAFSDVTPVGYNTTFLYPDSDLSVLAGKLASHCTIQYEKRAVVIEPHNKHVIFSDNTQVSYDTLISTLPLNMMLELTGISLDIQPDPCTSVLVLNIGAVKGAACPVEQWLYHPDSRSGFHRIGFYSHVDPSFLPKASRKAQDRVAIYVERAFPHGQRLTDEATQRYGQDVIRELQEWQFIGDVEVVHPTWIDVAYTWAWPNSDWRQRALLALEAHDIYQVGRYGQWRFQGIANSLREGLLTGASLKQYYAS